MSRTARFTKTNIITLGIIIATIGGGLFWRATTDNNVATITQSFTQDNRFSFSAELVRYPGMAGKTALELLKEHTEVQSKSSSFGEYVTAINGSDGGGKKYWIFYVNGKASDVGADSYTTKTGDAIEWRLE